MCIIISAVPLAQVTPATTGAPPAAVLLAKCSTTALAHQPLPCCCCFTNTCHLLLATLPDAATVPLPRKCRCMQLRLFVLATVPAATRHQQSSVDVRLQVAGSMYVVAPAGNTRGQDKQQAVTHQATANQLACTAQGLKANTIECLKHWMQLPCIS
ncbi:hypothetical protein COO60DRAFT_1516451 [Scenedesmus sp. NREL 46B-D3]|nr:hypothetical protein COO60DRAFT_1516451 [Scenedesmus sp. NREL 46B-D3]